MEEIHARRRAETDSRRRRAEGLAARPDRVALWAFVMAIAVTVAAAASAQAGSGGIADPASVGEAKPCQNERFGERRLALGDCGADVKTLNWILKSKRFERGVATRKVFESPTDATVRAFQRRKSLDPTGTVNRRTHRKLVKSMRTDVATWYGPGFFGNRTACGKKLKKRTVGVAHKRLPCGTKVTFEYRGRFLRTKVIDRGPYAHGARWDLTRKAARKLGFTYTDELRAAPIK